MATAESTEGTYKLGPAFRVFLALKNPASKLSLKDQCRIDGKGKVEGPDERWAIELVQVTEAGLVLDVPTGFCDQGQRLSLLIRTEGMESDVEADFSVKVVKLHLQGRRSERESVDLEFLEFDEVLWKRLCDSFQDRQGEVLRAFQAIKE